MYKRDTKNLLYKKNLIKKNNAHVRVCMCVFVHAHAHMSGRRMNWWADQGEVNVVHGKNKDKTH